MRRTAISFGQRAKRRSGVTSSDSSSSRTVQSPVRWMSSVTGLGNSMPVASSKASQAAGANRPTKTIAFSGEKRPLRSFQGALSLIIAAKGSGADARRTLYYAPERRFVSTPRKRASRPLPEPQLTPSLRCRLVDEVVYWNNSFLSG